MRSRVGFDPDVSRFSAAAAALAATVADAGSRPPVTPPDRRPQGDGPGVIDAIARVNAVLDAPAVVRHASSPRDSSAPRRAPPRVRRRTRRGWPLRATAAEHRGERDAVDDAVGSDDARGVDASYASSEATAVREGWSRAPSSARGRRRPPRRSPRRRARSRRGARGDDCEVSSRRRRSRLPSRAETAGTALRCAPPHAVLPRSRRGGRRRHRANASARRGRSRRRAGDSTRRRGCQKRTRDGIVRIVRRSAGGARGGSRAVPRPRGRVRFRARDATPEWEAIEARLEDGTWVPPRAALDFQPRRREWTPRSRRRSRRRQRPREHLSPRRRRKSDGE